MSHAVALAAALVVTAACAREPKPAAPAGLGRPLVTGPVRAVSPSADGAWAAILDGCAEVAVPSLPPGTASCTLRVAPAAGGDALRLAGAVTTLPQGVLWSRSGATLAALSEYEYPSASGTLVVWRPGGAPRAVAERVTFFGFGEGGDLGYVAGGRFGVVRADGTERKPGYPGDVATFELGPRGGAAGEGRACGECPAPALLRRTGASGGALVDPCCGGATLATGVTEYGFSPSGTRMAWVTAGRDGAGLWVQEVGARSATRLAGGAQSFAWGRHDEALAFVSDLEPGKQGDLHVWAGRKDTMLLARGVGEYRWATRAPRLVWLERYDPQVRAGTVGAGAVAGLPPRTWANHVTDAAISADGRHVAFLRHTARGGYTIDLGLAHVDAPAPPRFDVVASGVYGFAFSPDGAWLYYQTRCVGEAADACDVERIPAGGLAPGAKPEQVVQGAAAFEFAPDDPERLLVTWRSGPRGSAVDVGVWDRGRLVRVDAKVRAGTARFAGPGSRRVLYAVADEARAGAYVAEVP